MGCRHRHLCRPLLLEPNGVESSVMSLAVWALPLNKIMKYIYVLNVQSNGGVARSQAQACS